MTFEDADGAACRRELGGRRESGQAAADDERIEVRDDEEYDRGRYPQKTSVGSGTRQTLGRGELVPEE
jgi:hypothetical protein